MSRRTKEKGFGAAARAGDRGEQEKAARGRGGAGARRDLIRVLRTAMGKRNEEEKKSGLGSLRGFCDRGRWRVGYGRGFWQLRSIGYSK